TILGETFEWMSFMSCFPESGNDDFPNGVPNDAETKAKLRTLYPNLYKFYDQSVAMTNFHAREKTDISENLSIIGCYPTEKLTNYDYPKNTVVTSLARTLKAFKPETAANIFHNGTNNFYNRNVYHPNAVGFDSYTSQDQMVDMGMTSYIDAGERNLDSEMVDTCYEQMFPTDKPFYTYITTITQHGQYEERKNLQKYYDKLDACGLAPMPEENDKDYATKKYFRTYVAAAMELDAAIGRIDYYLETRGLKDNTIVVLFGDHNAYYYSLSNYVKDITDRDYTCGKNYTDLYRVPFMVRIGNGEHKEYAKKIDKFTCTADILPTIYDLLGIKTYSNLLYGQSVFTDSESVLYSRAYDVFFTDKVYFSSLNRIYYKSDDVDATYMTNLEEASRKLLDKTGHTNRIFYCDYFQGEKGNEYYQKLRDLNQEQA
ncbi:MAG: sulfatase-like hydrolase/transferase, partial [Clostridiales bacterium]|nr:sulfatase-like hydrolase/transferase [Clostridiales bacterium]